MRYIQRIPLLALALSLVAVQAFAYDGSATYEISHVYSNVSFSIMKFFFEEDGGFRSYTGEVYYDPAHPQRSHVKMTVQAASIDTRGEGRDRALSYPRVREYFRHAEIRQSTRCHWRHHDPRCNETHHCPGAFSRRKVPAGLG
jgi:polyisoprenoid-binding protein YceI